MDEYVFVADESGNPGITQKTSNTFVFGGYVLPENEIDTITAVWRRAKFELCDSEDVELKWKHFFVRQPPSKSDSNPIKIDTLEGRRHVAAWILQAFFKQTNMLPAVAVSQKDRATDVFITKSKKGNLKIDDDVMWIGPIAQFAVFLSKNNASGRLIFDSLNKKVEDQRQKWWSEHLRKIRDGELPEQLLPRFKQLLSIEEKIEFHDSKISDLVQIADFVCGVIWNAGQGDEAHLGVFQEQFGQRAEREGLGILHIR